MLRILSIIVVLAILVGGYAWYSAQSLPAWFDDSTNHQDQVAERLSEKIKKEGVGSFLGSKVGDILTGKLELSETEFNALFLASLKLNEDGQKLLAVSDGVNAIVHDDHIELGAIINLDKVEEIIN